MLQRNLALGLTMAVVVTALAGTMATPAAADRQTDNIVAGVIIGGLLGAALSSGGHDRYYYAPPPCRPAYVPPPCGTYYAPPPCGTYYAPPPAYYVAPSPYAWGGPTVVVQGYSGGYSYRRNDDHRDRDHYYSGGRGDDRGHAYGGGGRHW